MKFKLSVRMQKKGDLREFECGDPSTLIFILGLPHTVISQVHRERETIEGGAVLWANMSC